MKLIVGLWVLVVILLSLTVVTQGLVGVIFGSFCGIALGLSTCITTVTLVGRKA